MQHVESNIDKVAEVKEAVSVELHRQNMKSTQMRQ